jgi:hypothetical protein
MTRIPRRLPFLFAALATTAFLLLPGTALATKAKVNLNSATQQELEALPGVGQATAKRIIAGRPYSSVDDLAKAGVPASTIEKIRSQVTAKVARAEKPAKPEKTEKASKPEKAEKAATPVPAAATTHAPAPASAPAAKPAADDAGKPAASAAASQPRQAPPVKGMVWVNTHSKVYHYEGDRWYGNTKEGKYMTEDEAIKAGYRASKEKQKSQ